MNKELPEFDEEKLNSILWEIANDTAAPLTFNDACKKQLTTVILDGIEKIRNRRSGGKEARENIRILISKMKQQAQNNHKKILDTETLNITLKEFCPCWPFC